MIFKKLIVALTIICSIPILFCSCGQAKKELPSKPSVELGAEESTPPLSFSTLTQDGNMFYAEVPEDKATFSFSEEIVDAGEHTLRLSAEYPIQNTLSLSSVGLSYGSNIFYLSSENNGNERVYVVNIYRKGTVQVEFKTGDAVYARIDALEGETIDPPEGIPLKLGYSFKGWDYSFDRPISAKGKTLVIQAKWEPLSDIFYFNSDENNCIITGVKNTSISSCVIPEYVTEISAGAFEDCKNLTYLEIPAGVSMQIGAFRGCSGLTEVVLPELESIPFGYYFPDSKTVRDVRILGGNKIADYAFYGLSSLVNVTLSDDITNIGVSAFEGCDNLSLAVLGSKVTTIGHHAFSDCSSLADINLPDTISSLGVYAFENCRSLLEIVIPASLDSIPDRAFSGCGNIKELILPNTLSSIGSNAFSECVGLTRVCVSPSVKRIENYAFYGCNNLERVEISDMTAWCSIEFGERANPLYYAQHLFQAGVELTEIVIPEGVTSICSFAFENAKSIKKVFIPSTVRNIGEEAFRDCDSLASFRYGGDRNDWSKIKKGWMWIAEYQDNILLFYNCKEPS